MLNYENESGYIDYYKDVINQYIDAEVSRRTAAVEESHEELQQKHDKLRDECNNYYQAYVFSDYSST